MGLFIMAMTIGGLSASNSVYTAKLKSKTPKPDQLQRQLAAAAGGRDFETKSPQTIATEFAAQNPAFARAQNVVADMNGLAKQAGDTTLSTEDRAYLNARYNDLKSQLTALGLGAGGVQSTDLSSAVNADAAYAATNAATQTLIQQQSVVQSDAYRSSGQDQEIARQRFAVEQFLDGQQQQYTQSNADVKLNAVVTAYQIKNDTAIKRDGVLKLLA